MWGPWEGEGGGRGLRMDLGVEDTCRVSLHLFVYLMCNVTVELFTFLT